ncbi:MAG: co-chaperone GroES, partial [Clostridia bacterium]|nr:co-chaperone GroES [Clostridia bacterium]
MFVKKGQKVVVAKYAGTEIKIDDVDYTIIRQSDILAIAE